MFVQHQHYKLNLSEGTIFILSLFISIINYISYLTLSKLSYLNILIHVYIFIFKCPSWVKLILTFECLFHLMLIKHGEPAQSKTEPVIVSFLPLSYKSNKMTESSCLVLYVWLVFVSARFKHEKRLPDDSRRKNNVQLWSFWIEIGQKQSLLLQPSDSSILLVKQANTKMSHKFNTKLNDFVSE